MSNDAGAGAPAWHTDATVQKMLRQILGTEPNFAPSAFTDWPKVFDALCDAVAQSVGPRAGEGEDTRVTRAQVEAIPSWYLDSDGCMDQWGGDAPGDWLKREEVLALFAAARGSAPGGEP